MIAGARWRERATGRVVRLVEEFSRPTAPAFHYEDEHPEEWWACPKIDFELNFEPIDTPH